jgi:hypothetical protein
MNVAINKFKAFRRFIVSVLPFPLSRFGTHKPACQFAPLPFCLNIFFTETESQSTQRAVNSRVLRLYGTLTFMILKLLKRK